MQDKYYINQLYPLQDKVLALIANLPVDFYLTGGTALSRAYYNHRFSDDLDFFLNWSPNFSSQFQTVYNALKVFDISLGVKSESFARCFISKNDIVLKLDFVNDVSYRRDAPINTSLFFRTDCVANILSNKISAISRNEPKDIADIIEISQYYSFNWVEIFNDAKKKDLNVDELDVAQ